MDRKNEELMETKNKYKLFITFGSSSFFIVFILLICLFMLIASIGTSNNDLKFDEVDVGMFDLPDFINSEMLTASYKVKEQYGYPVSVCIAQIIAESGFGKYNGLSGLAYNHKNLFGLKKSKGWTGQTVAFRTKEQTKNGTVYYVTAYFKKYDTYTDSINDRAETLHRSYHVDGITDANEFAKKVALKWATDINYYEKLVSLMSTYNLYILDQQMISGGNDEIASSSIIDNAKKKLGCKYELGAAHSISAVRDPNTKVFDCSSFVCWSYYQSGKDIGILTSKALNNVGKKINFDELRAGDIIVYSKNGKSSGIHHVALYEGNGKIIHAKGKKYGVVEDNCTSGYYRNNIYSCRRV